MTPSGYHFRRLQAHELPVFNALHNVCHGVRRPLEEAQWLYGGNPYGEAIVMAAFDERGKLAGVRPAIAWRIACGGEERTAYEFADALVAPRHRNRGIFSHLVELTCELAASHRYALYSIPNERSLPVYRRTPALRVAGDAETRVRPLHWARFVGHRLGIDGHGGVDRTVEAEPPREGALALRPVERFDSSFAAVHAAFAALGLGHTLRRRAFLQWRYFGSPLRRYRVALVEEAGAECGYLALRMIGPVAHLVDLFVAPEMELARRALRLACAWAAQMGAIAVHFNSSRGSLFQQAAARSGFWLRKRSGHLVLDRDSAQRLRQHYFVMGDFDFF